jgi:hypothetical protein
VQRRLRDPAFRRRLDEARRDVLRQVTDLTTQQLVAACTRLARILASADNATALKAIKLAYTHVVRLHELADVAGRLADIQSRLPPKP